MARACLALVLYAGAFLLIYGALQIDPILRFPVSAWSAQQWIAAQMVTLGLCLKLAGHFMLLSWGAR